MISGAYYNENDRFSAAWLRKLIAAKVIADGEVDERSIEVVEPEDLRGFRQCHFFAGIGVWSFALRNARWADDNPVWTGSCPCQSFSVSGKREGFSDKRHLWPAWFRLVEFHRPVVLFGEQVASNDGLAWFDTVSSDLERTGYAVGAADTCAAGFGAPHIRQRLYFVAHAERDGRWTDKPRRETEERETHGRIGANGELADAASRNASDGNLQRSGEHGLQPEMCESSDLADSERIGSGAGSCDSEPPGERRIQPSNGCNLGNAEGRGCGERGNEARPGSIGHVDGANETRELGKPGISRLERFSGDVDGEAGNGSGSPRSASEASALGGFWKNAEWIACRDGKSRPVEPGTFPLAYGITARVGRLRGYGNALVAPQAEAFIRAYMSLLNRSEVP